MTAALGTLLLLPAWYCAPSTVAPRSVSVEARLPDVTITVSFVSHVPSYSRVAEPAVKVIARGVTARVPFVVSRVPR